MSKAKIGLAIFLAVLIVIQFIQHERNQSREVPRQGIKSVTEVPENVQLILKRSCYDCHSNNTRYPWYAHIQPAARLMYGHIKEGKAELNFDEFGSYSKRRQLSKLRAIEGSMEEETMPLKSYLVVHRRARLSAADQTLIKKWAANAQNILKTDKL